MSYCGHASAVLSWTRSRWSRSQDKLHQIYPRWIFELQRSLSVLISLTLNIHCRAQKLVESDLRRLSAS